LAKSLSILILTLASITLNAQSQTVPALAAEIVGNITDDSLQVRALYEWITDNIEYDTKLYKKAGRRNVEEFVEMQQPDVVLKDRKAVCMGYSILFTELCKVIDVPVETVPGYSKSIDPSSGRHQVSEMLHSWNAVKVNEKWYLLDLTWSAGYVEYDKLKFHKRRNEDYYLSEGENFIARHLPFDPVWQLMDYPLTQREFRLYQEMPPQRNEVRNFNYKDSLELHFTIEPEIRKILAYERAIAFDPSLDMAKSSLGYHYMKEGLNYLNQIGEKTKIFQEIKKPEDEIKAIALKEELLEMFEISKKNLLKSRYYYSKIPTISPFGSIASVQKNNITNNLNSLASNRSNLMRFIQSLEKRQLRRR
jgi:hypothetical protein